MPLIKANSISIFYEVHGKGTPLVLISGLGGDHHFWQSSIQLLSAFYQVIVFDTRGIGKTDTPESPYSVELFAEDMAGLMDALHIQKAHILGFSMGGVIAQAFAAMYPGKVAKLILAATFPVMNMQSRLFLDAVAAVYKNGASAKEMFNLILPWLFAPSFLSNPANAAFLQFDEDEPEQQPLHAWLNQYDAMRNANTIPLLGSIHCPVLIVSAEQDRLAHVEDGNLLARHLKGAMFSVIKNSGHLMNFEQPEKFHAAIINFCGSRKLVTDQRL